LNHKLACYSNFLAFRLVLTSFKERKNSTNQNKQLETTKRKMEMKEMSIIIESKGLSKTFNGVQALKPLNLKVQKNSIFGFLGPNGAGKTTTMKLLLGLIKPTNGSGTIFGHDIVQDNINIRARIGYLPQDLDIKTLEHLTARELLRFAAKFYFKGPKQMIEDRVQEMLDLVSLSEKADRPIAGFSGGEVQRLGIAQAQINYPDLLILDEPAASLDPIGRRDVLEVMERLRKYTTIFYSTHILDDVQKVSDNVAILNKGELIAQGSIEELLAGSEGLIYNIKIRGDTTKAYHYISGEPWIKDINILEKNGYTTWQVGVTDSSLAEQNLLRLLLKDEQLRVVEFQQKSFELEDVFLNLVEG
jgi:ABC-2 type transport system ATP-binding protein